MFGFQIKRFLDMQQVTFSGCDGLEIVSELFKHAPVHLKRFRKCRLLWEEY